EGLHRRAATRRLCRLSRTRRSPARRRPGDARLLLGTLAPAVLRPGQITPGADRRRGPEADRRTLPDRSRDPRQERPGAPGGAPGENQAAGRGAENLARDQLRAAPPAPRQRAGPCALAP